MNKANLLAKTKSELLKMAQRLGLRGVSTLKKEELADRIHQAQQRSNGKAATERTAVGALTRKMTDALKRRAIRKHTIAEEKLAAAASVRPQLTRSPRRGPALKTETPKAKTPKPAKEVESAAPPADELSAHKFDVAPARPTPKQVFVEEHLGDLPESYGTSRLFLTARDPHWLFAYWDLSWQQMADYRGQSSDGRLILRVFEKNHAAPVQELTLGHDSRNWYIPVNKAATSYSAQLGFWDHHGHFHVVSQSREVSTPADTVSSDTTARFVTIPIDFSFGELLNIIRGHMKNGEALADALHRLQRAGFKFPFQVGIDLGPWTAEQAKALERLLGSDILRRIRMGSFEITEWLRRRLQEELSSGMFSLFSPAGASWSGQAQPGFWFAVNSELIIYGATEPTAKVTIDGKPVELRSDGTFSFHFAFPDGQFRLPVVAVSSAQDDQRAVELSFERQTKTKGEVGKVKQSPHLKSPAAA
jgi:hypothetical protein